MTPFLFVSIALFIIWIALLLFSKQTRREQTIMSFVGLLISPAIILVASQDYRSGFADQASSLSIENILFVFSLFGIAAVIYEVLFGKHTEKLKKKKLNIKHPLHWVSHLIIIFGAWAFIAFSLMSAFSLASVQSFIVSGLLIGTYIIADRKDLLFNALLSGLLLAILIFLVEQIFFAYLFPESASILWQTSSLSGYFLGVVPIEEIVWAGVAGFAIGPLYEYVRDLKVK